MKKAGIAFAFVVIFLVPFASGPITNDGLSFNKEPTAGGDNSVPSDWQDTNSGNGNPLPGALNGLSVASGTSVIDYSHSAYVGIDPPLGWSSEGLEADLDHLSMWVDDVLVNPKLDIYHEEHWFLTDHPEYNYDPFFIPDSWTFVKNDGVPSGTQHPQHGYFEINRVAGAGYDASSGWRFDGNLDSGATINPTNGFYMSQQVPMVWRNVYSAEISFQYYVSSTSTLNDEVFISTSLEGYVSKYHVFESGTPMNTWLQASTTVPSSYFESLPLTNALLFNIGLGTDINGNPSTANHEVYIDELELRLLVRPFPEQIDLLANGARVTGSTQGSVSPYVPDSTNRDCYSAPDSNGGSGGVDLNGYGNNGWLDVGADVPTTFGSDWSDAFAYQVGFQFPLHVPQGASITSANLRVEAASDSNGFPGMRVYVADEDNVAAFTSGYPLLPDRYDWVNTSVYWRPTTWTANGRYDTPDISSLIQEVVSRPGWQSGNYICIMIDYAYSNQQYTYNQIKGSSGFAQADLARLFVDYTDSEASDTIPSFSFNKNIVIDHTKVVSDLQDFPVLVDIWDQDLHLNAQPDGDDIAFLYNGQVIPYDLELFDKQGNGTYAHLVCWVNAPHLSSVEDTTIVMVYGDENLGSQENPEAVWDSGYSAVWHLNDNPAQPQWDSAQADYLPHQPQIVDSTSHNLDGTTYGTMTSTDSVGGYFGDAIDLDGVDVVNVGDYVDFGNPIELQMTGAFTVEAWFKADFIGNDYLVVKSGESGYRGWDISFNDDSSISPSGWAMFRYSPDGVNTNIVGYERVDAGQWYHVVGVFYPSVFARFYLNGELVDEVTTGIPASANDPARPVRIGRRSDNPGGTSYLDAIVDEVRISKVARSDAWIRTQYNNQKNPQLFLTLGEQGINFQYKKDITIDHNKVAADLTGFPVLIDMYDSDLHTKVQPDGDDIMFTSNGRSLPHEIELFDQQYNSTHAHLVAWVRTDISSVSDTVISMYYANSAMGTKESPEEVWRNQYQGVWHLGDDPSGTLPAPQIGDSTYNSNDGTTYGSMTQGDQVSGLIGNALEFDGSNDYVDCGDTASLAVGYDDFVMSLWFATTDLDVPLAIKGAIGTDAYRYMLSVTSSSTVKAEIDDNSASPGKISIYSASALNDGLWHYVVMVRNGNFLHFYIDGSEVPTSPVDITGYGSINSVEPFLIAACDNYDNAGAPNLFASARIDEVHVLSSPTTSEWILTEFNNQNDPSDFYSMGAEQEVTIPEEVPLDFMYKKDITIDHTKVVSDLSGFPTLIDLYDEDLRFDVQADGDDIVFVKDDWILPCEIELFEQSYNSSHAHLVAWVKTDLSSSVDTVITMYYGNPAVGSQENAVGVWNSNYKGVWHLGESSGGALDSTSFGTSGSVSAGVTRNSVGVVGSCYEFNGANGNVNFGNPSDGHFDFGVNTFSYSFWVRLDQSTSYYQLPLFKGGTTTSDPGYECETNTAGTDLKAEVSDGTTQVISDSTSVTFGQWMYIVAVVDIGANLLKFYRNGVLVGTSKDISSLGDVSNSQNLQLSPLPYPLDGAIDEVRVMSKALAAEWILTEYRNLNDMSNFLSLGVEQEVIVPKQVPLGFMYKKNITIDHTKVVSDLSGFPTLIDLYDEDLRFDVQTDGDDIVFAKDGWILPYEIELFEQSYNSSHAHLIAWVRMDLSSSSDTIFSMYYGNPVSSSYEDPEGVWDISFGAVWHLSEDPAATVYDSTAYGNDGIGLSASSGPTLQQGKIDGCAEFYGETTKDRIEVPHSSSLVLKSDMMIEAWVRTTNADGSSDVIVAKWGDVDNRNYWLGKFDGSTLAFYVDSTQSVTASLSLVNDGNWHHVVGVANAVSGNLFLYVDGIERASASYSGSSQTGTSVLQIANNPGTAFIQEWDGRIDEVRVSESFRSPGWIQTEYNNQYNPESFINVSSEVSTTPSGFAYKKDITIDHTKVSANLNDFPMLIDIFDTDLRTDVQADGDDIMFKSGYNWCPHEIVSFNQIYNETHAHLIAWVRADLSSSIDTTITMYYGNPDLTPQQNPNSVWNDYVGVWHLDESPTGAVVDSSQYNNDGTTLGSMTGSDLVSGQVGSGFELDGIDDMISISESSSLDSMNYAGTLSLWINWVDPSNGLGIQRILSTSNRFIANPTPPPNYLQVDGFEWGVQLDGDCFFYPWGGNGNDYNLVTNPFSSNYWHFVVLTLDYSTKSVKMFFDGNLLTLQTENVPSLWTQLANLGDWIWGGNNVVPNYQVEGKFDEIRVSPAVRSSGWILTEYNNQVNPSSFYTIGSEEQISGNGYIFTTSSESSITISTKLSLGVRTSILSYADDFTQGTSFSIVNGSLPVWTANVMISPPPELEAVSFEISYPEGDWWPFSVASPSGVEKTFAADWTCFNGKLIVSSTAIDDYGMWKIEFLDRNHVLDTQIGPSGGPYSTTGQFTVGQDIEFHVWSSGTIDSTISLDLTDPSGATWYTGSTTFQGTRFSLPYYHRKYLTISHDNVAEDLVNFPVLVDIYDTDLRTDVRTDGRDIAFTIGEKTLSHEIELFDQTYNLTHAHLVAWVNVPMLSGSTDTIVSMYYGNPLAPIVYDSGPVWDPGYLGVWHLSESGTGVLGDYRDSSQYKNDGQGGEGDSLFVPTQTVGKIGAGQDFNNLDGYYDFIDCGNSPLWDIDGYQITLEAWIQHDITPNNHVYGIMNHKGWYDGYALYINYGGGSTIKPTFSLPGDTHQLVGANDVTGGSWHQIVATYDGSLMKIYVDGVQDPNVLAKTNAIEPSSFEKGFWIGQGDQPQNKTWSAEWDGQIDEVRVSDVMRSAGWIQTQFNNQYNPGGFYSIGMEENIGYSESVSINLDTSAPAGVWHVTSRYSDANSDVNFRTGLFDRSFIVRRGTSLSLSAPGDAILDGVSTLLVGEQLYVEFNLQDTLASTNVSGATVSMNWSVSGTPTNVQLNDYGDGRYGKTLNTSDLGSYGRWRLNLEASHPFYTDAADFFYLDLSHRTFMTYEPPEDSAYGDDFEIRLTLKDQFDYTPLTGATLSCNATILGTPTDYGNGTYLVTLDSSGFSIGEHTFRFTATPSTSYLLSSSIDVQLSYRPIATMATPLSPDAVEAPWGQQVNTSIYWSDVDHAGIGVDGGTLSISPFIQIQIHETGGGYYLVTIDVTSLSPGAYFFNLTCSKPNYQSSTATISILILAHRTTTSVDYNSTIPVGTDVYFDVHLVDIDLDAMNVGAGNLTQVSLNWGTGSDSYSVFSFGLDTSGWAVGSYSINVTVRATASPRFYMDSYIVIQLEIRRLGVYVSWEPLEPFPNGNDFVMFVHVNVSEPGSPIDGTSIVNLDQTYFSALNDTGALYIFESFANLGNGRYQITIDSTRFLEGQYKIIVFVDFLPSENYTDSSTTQVSFTYRPILTYLSSPDYPSVTTSFDTNVTITLSYVDIDNSQNITIGFITSEGASIEWQHKGGGVYEVLIIVQGWDLGAHEVNLTADASGYQAKTLTFQILVQIAYAYARSSVSIIDLPLGNTAVFYADYWDITHDEAIIGATVNHNWTYPLSISWTGDQYRIELPSTDTDGLGTYLLMLNFSKGPNYQFGYFNISIILRTHLTEFRLASAIEPTSYNSMVNISVYCGDLDTDAGVIDAPVDLSIHGESGWISSTFRNDTTLGNGYYIISFAATNLGPSGIYNLTVYFNWTGPVPKFYDGSVVSSVRIVGEASDLELIVSAEPTPYLENLSYTYFYSELYSGNGISNASAPAGNVFIFVEFLGQSFSPSLFSIREDSGNSGHYTIEFNSTIFDEPGVYTMIVYVNWTETQEPFYGNWTDTVSVRVIPRSTLISLVPPESTPFGVNATFSFSFDDVAGGSTFSIASSSQMRVSIGLPDFSLTYNASTRQFHVSFNTSILGAPLGTRQFTIGVSWIGAPYYANVTGRNVIISIRFRETEFDYSTISPVSYGDNVTLHLTFSDSTLEQSKSIDDGFVTLYNGSQEIPVVEYSFTILGNGEYEIELKTTYFDRPGTYAIKVVMSTSHFYYAIVTASRTLSLRYRLTVLLIEPVEETPFNNSLQVVFHYSDVLSLSEIGNSSTPTTVRILNGSSWFFNSVWRGASEDYLLTIQTYNQNLEINREYVLWIEVSYPESSPFYLSAEAFISFILQERATNLEITESPEPTQYLDNINFAVYYQDSLSLAGINGATITLTVGGTDLIEGVDYVLLSTLAGIYYISLNTTAVGSAGSTAILELRASWADSEPYYSDSTLSFTLSVTERNSITEIVSSTTQVKFLENVTFTIRYSDETTGQTIQFSKDQLLIYNEGILLSSNDFSMVYLGSSYKVSINSSVLVAELVSNWNITFYVDWQYNAAPYYADGRTSSWITVKNRIGIVTREPAPTVPIHDNLTLDFTYSDDTTGAGINDAIVIFDCVSPSGLMEGVDFWVYRNSGNYSIFVNTTSLGGIGTFTFTLRLFWNPTLAPFYRNTSIILFQGTVRLIQLQLTNEEPIPSTVPINENVSVILNLLDLDHLIDISGAESSFSVKYKTNASGPAIWSVTPISPGVYEMAVDCFDAGSIGTNALIITLTMPNYQTIEVQVPFQIRLREGELNELISQSTYYGEATYVVVELVDQDAGGTPISDATLIITWPDIGYTPDYTPLGDGQYNISLTTSSLEAGLYTLVIGAAKGDYFISDISVPVQILSIPTELILPQSIQDVFWGDDISVWAVFNDTRTGTLISGALLTYQFGGLSGSLTEIVSDQGNYTVTVDTGNLVLASTYVISITASFNNYVTITSQIIVNVLKLPITVSMVSSAHQEVFKGTFVNVTVYVNNTYGNAPLIGANVKVIYYLQGEQRLDLFPVPGKEGYYVCFIDTDEFYVGDYSITIEASGTNYIRDVVPASIKVKQITTVLLLDGLTSTYSERTFNWSDTIRIGVYVLAPSLNESNPYSTGLANCTVLWSLSGTVYTGEFLNGTSIFGPGYFYFDFETWNYYASTYTLRITAYPNVGMFAYSTNHTTLIIEPIETSVESTYLSPKIWGWTGWINLTYWDLLFDRGIAGANLFVEWEGIESVFRYVENGTYQIFINATLVGPGIYPVSVRFQMDNYRTGTGVFTLNVKEVPTEIAAFAPTINQIDEDVLNLQVPYGDVLSLVLFYNDTWYNRGIIGATETTCLVLKPPTSERDYLSIEEVAHGNYSLLVDTTRWAVNPNPYRLILSFHLTNWSRTTLEIHLTIIDVPTALRIEPDTITMNYAQVFSIWVLYYDTWEGHMDASISGASINATSLDTRFVVVSLNQSDPTRPGWYEIRVRSQRAEGTALVSIILSKDNYVSARALIEVSVEPSEFDTLVEQAIIFGVPVGLILLLGAVLWTRLFSVPKQLREIRRMVKTVEKGKIPKPPDNVLSRQEIVADLFNDIAEPIGITKAASDMPSETITSDVPEIEELLIQLSILSRLSPEELEDFKIDVSKMKLSEQVSFVKEVINQEAIKQARLERKPMEVILEETAAKARAVLAGEEIEEVMEPEPLEERIVPPEVEEPKEAIPEPVEFEEVESAEMLDEDELKQIRQKLVSAGIKGSELETIMDQARELPRELAEELLRSILGKGGEDE